MKNMKRMFLYLGMGSCVSTKTAENPPSTTTTSITVEKGSYATVQTPFWEVAGSKESKDEQFFDSKPWLESDDDDFLSVNGDMSPRKLSNNNDEHQRRKLSELFKDSSFSSDSQTSLRAAQAAVNGKYIKPTTTKSDKENSARSVKRCLPSLVRSLSCGDRKKRLSHDHIAVVG